MSALNLDMALICLTIIALVAITYGKTDLTKIAVEGISTLASDALQLLRRL